ncbi:YdeI/OmpD-associated family protein [Pseudocolwellia sp. HL-MZ19]|uniref:YdeI/OmpD-associated family protein n=1 Tax=Pseudocolwellia sp. HL-MZ19 TaxID=3400846 RepID=UPI003CF4A333
MQALIPLGKMKPAGMHVFNNRSDKQGYSSEDRNIPLASKYEVQIKANQAAWDYFTCLAPSYKRDSIWWVMSAKKQETQLRRLAILISSSELGEKIPSLRKK